MGTLFGVPILQIIVFRGLSWVPLILGNCHFPYSHYYWVGGPPKVLGSWAPRTEPDGRGRGPAAAAAVDVGRTYHNARKG